MARQYNLVEVNKFNAGLITDASPLTTPDNSSLDENNFVLNIDGSRNRRLGLDYEEDFVNVSTPIEDATSTEIAITTYRWDNAGGNPEKSLQVVQTANIVKFFDMDNEVLSSGLIHTATFNAELNTTPFSYTVVDGLLIIATSEKQVYVLEYNSGVISQTTSRLLIRDLFGVEDVVGGVDITRSTDVQTRPSGFTNQHVYNLRNQSWGIPRIDGSDASEGVEPETGGPSTPPSADPITIFRQFSSNRFPSNSDSVTESLYPDAENVSNRTIDRFFAEDLYRNPLGTGRAALGYFIIDALDRGVSRLAEDVKNRTRYPELNDFTVTSLPQDITPNGPKTITEFAGRVFYAGFPGAVTNGDKHSPKMSSYILFSKVVDSVADINLCYQEGDPTSKTNPDIIDTDGGFIRINEAYDIQKLVNLGGSLMVIAANGVWTITGGTDKGFTATSYIVQKITDRGCIAANSITNIDNTLMFWGKDAIYHITPNQVGDWACNNITFGRIQNFYDAITFNSKSNVKGEYDSYERKIRWVYDNRIGDTSNTKELVLDVQLQAFYTNVIGKLNGNNFPKLVSTYVGKPYIVSATDISVVIGTDPVVVGVDPVVVTSNTIVNTSQREVGYVMVTSVSPTLTYTFGSYRNTAFRDWFSEDNIGIDADAYLITSYLSGTDFQRDKQVMYITTHFRRTETGFDEDMNPLNPSSCITQSRWGWSNSDNSGKWGREFQAYRYRLPYFPLDDTDTYDNGFSTVITRNKLRGSGKVLSLKFRTEPYNDLHLYGWSMVFSTSENV